MQSAPAAVQLLVSEALTTYQRNVLREAPEVLVALYPDRL
jgi:hypothetical protein